MKRLTIDIDEDEGSVEITVEEVLRQIKNGNTSGVDPSWDLVKVE